MRAKITGVGHYVPDGKLTNQDLGRMLDTSDEWITTRTGIKERRILDKGKGVSHMAARAAERVLEQRGASAEELDLIVLATVTPDMMVPSAAALVQKKLKAVNCWGFDLNGGCTGFIYALAAASQFVETGKCRKVMVIGADKMSAVMNYEDRNTCVLFGDGAGAVLLEPSEEEDEGIRDFILHLDGEGEKHLNIPAGGSRRPATRETVENGLHFVVQDGKAVFKAAIAGMKDVSTRLMERNHLQVEDITLFIPHQANNRIIDAVSQRLGLTREQVVVNIANYGNTTAATIPIALSECYRDKRMARGDWIITSAFGAGFTWGGLLLKWAME
ncbi:MAG: ketoacyl-ACP synthase III [Desulfobacterales bacterium]|nr:ketoacyl-ACP synthase III [Desulfobacterales bacterium]